LNQGGNSADNVPAGSTGKEVVLSRMKRFGLAPVNSIEFYDAHGDDRLYNNTSVASEADGAQRFDKLWGGDGNDLRRSGAGNDMLEGLTGIDAVHREDGDNIHP
jgi:Ca2+-binding RTX toxin-like protein